MGGQQIKIVLKPFIGRPLLNGRRKPASTLTLVGLLQSQLLRRDRAIQSPGHIRRGGQIDVAEKRQDDCTKQTNGDQSQLERRRSQGLN